MLLPSLLHVTFSSISDDATLTGLGCAIHAPLINFSSSLVLIFQFSHWRCANFVASSRIAAKDETMAALFLRAAWIQACKAQTATSVVLLNDSSDLIFVPPTEDYATITCCCVSSALNNYRRRSTCSILLLTIIMQNHAHD